MDRFKHLKNYKIVLGSTAVIVIMLFILNEVAGMVGLILAIAGLYEISTREEAAEQSEIETIENLCEDFDSAAQDSVFNMPFPLVLTDEKGIIKWYNPALLKQINESNAVGKEVETIIEGFNFEEKLEVEEPLTIKLNDKNYLLYKNRIDKTDGTTIYLFYFVDNTEYDNLLEKYNDKKVGFGHIYIDNYDEIGLGKKGYIKSVILAEVRNTVINYFTEKGAVIRRYDNDKFMAVFNQLTLEEMIEDRFSVLDTVREIGEKSDSTITLSVGISETLVSLPESFDESRIAVDLALGRGGDQVVLRTKEGHEFFGGRTQAREKRNRVRSRVIGNSLKNLIEEASTIYIMGHKNADMDAIGSAIGMLGSVRRMGQEGFIILNETNPSIDIIVREMKKRAPELYQYVISSEEAIENADKLQSLIIQLDTHKPYLAEEPRMFEIVDKVVNIDHHRKGNDAIENPVLSYVEPYASSTSELVIEILEYMDPDMNLTTFEAEAMLAGIVVDTKNFTFQTGVRTFEAASILRRLGANPTEVSKFFNDNIDTVRMRAKVVHDAKIIRNKIAVSKFEGHFKSNVLIAAQAADSLLNIVGVDASFVMTELDDGEIHISGRSNGELSVQLILEKMGGGGHLVSAATRLKDVTMDEAYDMLIDAIDDYFDETEEKENVKDEDNTTEGSR